MNNLKIFEVCYISGHTLKYNVKRVMAVSEQGAVDLVFAAEGINFENRLVSVKEVEI